MVDYPTDLDLDSSKDVYLDGSNDLAVVSGEAQLRQSVAIDAMDEIQEFIGGRVTGKNVGLLEERLRRAFNDDPQLDEVVNVNVVEYDRRTNELVIEATTIENENFTIEGLTA